MGVESWRNETSTPSLALPMVHGCCRFSGFTTTAYPLRVHGGGNAFSFLERLHLYHRFAFGIEHVHGASQARVERVHRA